MKTSYDIIGDIHGQYDALLNILDRLGYRAQDGRIGAPQNRQLISVGDVINKGPQPFECLDLIKGLVESDQAQMVIGNHEINAVHYQNGAEAEGMTRQTKQFAATLAQIKQSPSRWPDFEAFILSLPNRLELNDGGLRVVHAHWPECSFPKVITRDLLADSGPEGSLSDDLQRTVKGPEEASAPYVDRQGISRTKDRVRWWETYPADAPFHRLWTLLLSLGASTTGSVRAYALKAKERTPFASTLEQDPEIA